MKVRRARGYALISTMVIGVFSMTFLLALAQFLTTVNANQALQRHRMELRAAAEAGIDYAMAKLNKALVDNDTTKLDPFSETLPTGYLTVQSGSVSNNGSRVTVSVKVSTLPTPSSTYSTWCSIYEPYLATAPALGYKIDYWRVIESTARFDNGTSKTIRTLVRPESAWWNTGGSQPTTPAGATPRSYFPEGFVANSTFNFDPADGNLTVQELGGSTFKNPGGDYYEHSLNIVSNGNGTMNSTNVIGNVQIAQGGLDAPNNSQIEGRLTVSDSNDVGWKGNPGAGEADPLAENVLANADIKNGSSTRLGPNASAPEAENAAVNSSMNAVRSTPAGATQMATLAQISNLTTPIVEPGNYVTGNLNSVDVSGQVTVGDLTSASNPVRVFIEDSATTGNAVTISTDKFVNNSSDPRGLQIWYSGTRDINIEIADGNAFQGMIYAPNAKVTTTNKFGETAGNFSGAIVANNVQVKHSGTMNLITKASDVSSGASGGSENIDSGLRYFTIPDETDPTKNYICPWTYVSVTYEEK